MNQYPNSGKLSATKEKRNPKSPDHYGEIKMNKSTLKELMAEVPDDDEITIKLSGWNMQGNYGMWTRLSWNDFKPLIQDVKPALPKQEPVVDDSDLPF
jgi:hypothetical protein